MPYSNEHIQALIAQGENAYLEFKRDGVQPDDLAKEIVGMLNRDGGTILLGVEDDGSVRGITEANELWVSNICRNNIVPAVDLNCYATAFEGKQIFVIEVPKGKDKPYQTNRNQFIIRIGSTNRNATQQELLRLFQQSGIFHYDANPVEGADIIELNFSRLDGYFAAYGIDFSRTEDKQTLLRNTDILHETGVVTVAGLLCFGTRPQHFMRQAAISFAHFAGNDMGADLLDKQVVEGNLDYQVNTALATIKNNWRVPSTITGAQLQPTATMYEDRVFRELLVNACVHRNYSIAGSRTRILLFDDRIEFRSPGRLPNTVTIEKLPFGVSYATNPVIVKFMENLGYIDKLGRGLPMVVQAAQKMGKSVTFEEFGEEFVVVLER
jgi:ATP-dependent DNA helicase RecG